MDGKPSNATKERMAHVIEQNITESGKLARSLCQRSGSREVRCRASIFMAYMYIDSTTGVVKVSQEDGITGGSNGEHTECKPRI